MREFLKAQLKALIIAGIRQMEFLDEKQVTDLLNELCVISQNKFNYIPVEIQQAEIKRQIIEDPEFNGINTRWLFKILSRISDKYWKEKQKEQGPALTEYDLTPASPEIAEKYLKQFDEMVAKATGPIFNNGSKELRESNGYSKSILNQVLRQKFFVGEVCPSCQGSTYENNDVSQGNCLECEGTGEIERVEVMAVSIEEARKAYNETFK